MGTFDASGAFLPLKVSEVKGPKEPIPEEQDLDFQGLEEEEEEPPERLDEEGPEAGKPAEGGGGCLRALGWAMGAEGPPPGQVPAAHLLHRRSGY